MGGFRRPLYLVYVYREEFGADVPPMSELVERLSPDHLLIAPQFTNRSDWWGGQFQVIGLALSVTATCFANTASAHAQGATTIATSMGARSASPWSPSDYVPSPDTTASPWQRSGHSALRPSDGRAASHLMSDHLSDGARRRFRQ